MNIIDTHVDTITTLMDNNEDLLKNKNYLSLEKLDVYTKKGIFFAIWLTREKCKNSFFETNKAIDFYYNQLLLNENKIVHCNSFDEFEMIFNSNKTASLLCIEGGEALEGHIDNLYHFYNRGVRLMTLTWNYMNELGSGTLGQDSGLTNFGKEVVKEMNRLNMIIDVSHLNYKGFFDVISLTDKPIIASHSNVFNVHHSKRNLHDEQLREIKNTKSIVSINLHSPFIDGTKKCKLNKILPHIDYLLSFLGEEYISIGTDFDGTDCLPSQINTFSDIRILYKLIEKTYNVDIANKIFYENQIKFLKNFI